MKRPLIGIVGNYYLIDNQYDVQGTGEMNVKAISEICDCISVVIPSLPFNASIGELLDIFDGFLFTGGRPNVHPSFYGQKETSKHGVFDLNRDNIALELIKASIEIRKPIFGICRGFQEFNVAYGGTLHPEIRDLPGRMNHRMPPDGTLEEKFALRHTIYFKKGGRFEQLFGSDEVKVNSLHGQGIDKIGNRVVVDGYASDGTPEAIYIDDQETFALAVQWHPEWNAKFDPISKKLFEAFSYAIKKRKKR